MSNINDKLPNSQENTTQILNDIQSLQTIERQLFSSLEENTSLTVDQQKEIIEKINNISKMRINLYETIKLFKKYDKTENNLICSFYDWLNINSNYVIEYDLLQNINNIFDLKKTDLSSFEKIKIVNCKINCENIKNILRTDGFVFPYN